MPECDFVETSRKRAGFQVDAPAGTEEIGIDNVRKVLPGSVIHGIPRILFARVIMGCQSKFEDVVPYL